MPRAYRLVRAHFAYLAAIVREHDGAIVKTIGDAVMAAFHDPLQGLRAAIAMQERVAAFNADNRAVRSCSSWGCTKGRASRSRSTTGSTISGRP